MQGWTLPLNVDDFATIGRRTLLRGLGASALVTSAGGFAATGAWGAGAFASYPFTLGVASGEPSPDGFVLWTKLAPKPLQHGAGMPRKSVAVDWLVAHDQGMRQIVQRGEATAYPEAGHSLHVEVGGLEPARDYFYCFEAGGERSPVGRSRTLPAAGAPLAQMRFAMAGCQRYDDGLFTAYRKLADENFDFVFHYGDYIYEYATVRPGERKAPVVRVMPGNPGETYTLDHYRHRYSLYQLDPDLQAAHASAPFVMTYDDHEVANDWGGDSAAIKVPPELFLLRRAAAFQAWYEHVPVRRTLLPRGPDVLAYRRFAVGDLMMMHVLDTRLYRSPQVCTPRVVANCADALDPRRTMLGDAQERWLYAGFNDRRSRWNVLAQQVMMMRNDRDPDPNVIALDMDKWDGAPAARERLFAAATQAKLDNMLVLTGDVHRHFAGELKADFADEKSRTVGVELVGSSISSGGDGFPLDDKNRALLAQDPHIKLYNDQRGYVRHTVRPTGWQADFQVLDKVSAPDGTMSTCRSFMIEPGRSELHDL